MGTYLCTGICTEVVVYKSSLKSKNIEYEALIKSLNQKVNLNLYDKKDEEDKITWNIKHDLIEKDLLSFLKSQFEIYDSKNHNKELYKSLEEAKTGEKMLNILSEEFNEDNFSEYLYIGEEEKEIKAHFNLIILFLDGKTFMESYDNILGYFEHMIKLQQDKYPLAETMKIFLSE